MQSEGCSPRFLEWCCVKGNSKGSRRAALKNSAGWAGRSLDPRHVPSSSPVLVSGLLARATDLVSRLHQADIQAEHQNLQGTWMPNSLPGCVAWLTD